MQNSIFSLQHYEFIRVSGPDTRSFLQGQLSCNMELLSAQRSLTGALCNLKGRVIADFRLLAQGEDCLMQCAEGMADTILTTLSKYAVFSKVRLEQLDRQTAPGPSAFGLIGAAVEAGIALLGLKLPATTDAVTEGESCTVIRLPGPARRIELWFHSPAAKDEFLCRAEVEPSDDLQAWQRADIEAGVIHVTTELSEEYTPQLLNYDISGLIDFKKGCYTGQEIVARMFYRGTAKKRLYLASSSVEVGADSRVVTESEADSGLDSAGGEILRFSNSEAPALLLAVLASEAIASGEKLQLAGQAGSDVCIRSLPYAEIVRNVASGG